MDIVEEIRQDREKGAKRLEGEYKAGLMALARRFCTNPSDAEELVNATFATVVENIDDYLEQSAFFAWMCQILMSLHSRNVRRKSNQEIVYPGTVADAVDEAAEEEIYRNLDRALVREALEKLEAEDREILLLHYFLDIPIVKMAKVLSIPAGTVKSRLHYARRALAAKLGVATKKPGAKALLIVFALAALTAIGAAVVTAAGGGNQSTAIDGDQELSTAIGSRLQSAADNSPTAQLSNSPTNQLQPAQGEDMNATMRTAALGTATALALAAAPPAATANGNQNLGTSAWDGQSWVYDTSRHVAAQHADGASPAAALDTAPRGVGPSGEILLDTVFMTRQWSNATSISGGSPAFIFMVR